MTRRLLLPLIAVCAICSGNSNWSGYAFFGAEAPATTQPASTQTAGAIHAREIVADLASDQMGGRLLGTPELARSADYLRERFEAARIPKLPGYADYFQTFEQLLSTVSGPETTMTCSVRPLKIGVDYATVLSIRCWFVSMLPWSSSAMD